MFHNEGRTLINNSLISTEETILGKNSETNKKVITYRDIPVDEREVGRYFQQLEEENDEQCDPCVRHRIQVEAEMSGTITGISHPSGHHTESDEC